MPLLLLCAFAVGRSASEHYRVSFDGRPAHVFEHACQADGARCGQETNNFASHTLNSKTVHVVVTSNGWTAGLGGGINIRPSHLRDSGVVGPVTVLNATGGGKAIAFDVHAPCQLSVEIGDEDSLFPDEQATFDFANLLLFVNPPVASWPRQPPTLAAGPSPTSSSHSSSSSSSSCTSSGPEPGRACVLGAADGSCEPLQVPANTDLWFRDQSSGGDAGAGGGARVSGAPPTEYLWGDGCGDSPKRIVLADGARVFLENDVVLYARVVSSGSGSGSGAVGGDSVAAAVTATTCEPAAARSDCGMPTGASQASCEAGGCCWAPVSPNPSNLPWCFRPNGAPTPAPAPPAPTPPAPPTPPTPATASGLYGYGVLSNVHMRGHKLPGAVSNVVDLSAARSEVFGVTVLDSTYRNVQLGAGGRLDWTKSMAWNSETDCVNLLAAGGRVSHNFFKTNDDCMKAYQLDTVYRGNVVWHQDVGRALMFSWGNLGEAVDTDGSVQFLDTTIIHDKLGFRHPSALRPAPADAALGWQAGMIYYSSLVNVQHSPSNHIGSATSPVYIEDLRLESRVGGLLLVTNGFAGLDGKAGWMGKDGCTGNVHMRINGLDLTRVRSFAAPSVAGGCKLGASFGNIENAQCICTAQLGCSAAQCAVNVTLENVRESTEPGGPSLKDTLIAGDNAAVSYSAAAAGDDEVIAGGAGGAATMCPCSDGDAAQKWRLSHVATGAKTVVYQPGGANSTAAPSCLTFDASSTLVTAPCSLRTASDEDRWTFAGAVLPNMQWQGANGTCLQGARMKAGGRLTHGACNGGAGEFWLYNTDASDAGSIANPEYGLCLSSVGCGAR
jgi:hypothetical protein